MAIDERIERVQREVFSRIADVRLLGEIELDDRTRLEYQELIRDLFKYHRNPCTEVPETVALMMVDVAKRTSNGQEMWLPILRSLVPGAFPGRPPDQKLQHSFGETLEHVLRDHKLPTFGHLVDQGAMRFRTPALAHSLIPHQLIPAYMEKVVSPALANGWSAADVQAWLAANPPAGLPLAVQRFVIHGGDVASDLVDRTVDYTRSLTTRAPDSGSGVPPSMRRSIEYWVRDGHGTVTTRQSPQRKRVRPYLLFDYAANEVGVVLPYADEAAPHSWVVSGDPGPANVSVPVWTPVWARRSSHRALCIDRPFYSLRVSLTDDRGKTLDSQLMPSLAAERPALFFHPLSGRALGGEFLDGDNWYLLRPEESEVGSDGALRCEDRLEAPVGWGGYTLEKWEIKGGTEITVATGAVKATWRLRAEEPKPWIQAHGTAPPPCIEPLDADYIALEGSLPVVCIPSGANGGDPRRLAAWQLTAVNASAARNAASPVELEATFEGTHWAVPLEELIPGEDVGTWDIGVRGPLGQFLAARLALLPADFQVLDYPTDPQFVGRTRKVRVATGADVTALEHGDRAIAGTGVWTLEDRNRNGRLPVTIRDSRSGRETACLLKLPTVEWQWLPAGSDWNEKLVLTESQLAVDRPRLRIRSSTPARITLRCMQAGNVLQEVALAGGRPVLAGECALAEFSTTVQSMKGAMCHFELATWLSNVDSPVVEPVGAVVRPLPVSDLRAQFEGQFLRFTWRQAADYSQMSAALSMHWRPWDEPAEVDVERSDLLSAAFALPSGLSGPASLEIRGDDDWVGEVTLSRRQLTVQPGYEAAYLTSLPATIDGRLERAIATSQHKRRSPDLDQIAQAIADRTGLYRLLRLLGWSIERGCTAELATLPWEAVAAALAAADFDPAPFLHEVAQAPPDASLFALLCGIGVPRWRSIFRYRRAAEGNLRRQLWARSRPLGAMLDLADDSDEDATLRLQDHLGAIDWPGGQHRGFLVAAGLVPRNGFVASKLALDSWKSQVSPTPQAFFSESGFAAACAADLEALQRGQAAPKAAEFVQEFGSVLQSMIQNIRDPRALGWDPAASRLPPSASGMELLPWASLVTAIWERRVARGSVTDKAVGNQTLAGIPARLALLVPHIYERDLCLAEAILARR